ncbi:energy-coupling factor transporter transmembrane protein EcfT [Candidatus Bathyarchaeota archaeon]|nr:energy-coupling factor transporter transmembrane protein EcfT [Candidatus Bathyarchaeota archaeon]
MSLLEGLRFSRGSSPLHDLDPRVKFFMTCILFVAAILFHEFSMLLIIFLSQIPIIIIGKIIKEWLKTLKGGLLLATMIFVTNLVSLYFFRGQQLTLDMLEYSLALTFRFLIMITSFSIFFLTTSPDKLSLALEKAQVPYEFNFAFITSIRFVPVIAEEAQSIMDAQKSRGLELEKGRFLSRIRNYIPILLPLIVNSIRRSLELAEAMESRAFGASKKRTNLYELEMSVLDYLVLGFTLLILIIIVYVRFFMQTFMPMFPPVRIL